MRGTCEAVGEDGPVGAVANPYASREAARPQRLMHVFQHHRCINAACWLAQPTARESSSGYHWSHRATSKGMASGPAGTREGRSREGRGRISTCCLLCFSPSFPCLLLPSLSPSHTYNTHERAHTRIYTCTRSEGVLLIYKINGMCRLL